MHRSKSLADLQLTNGDLQETVTVKEVVTKPVAVCIYIEFDQVSDPERDPIDKITFHYISGDFDRIVFQVDDR